MSTLWLPFSIFATFCFGISAALFKLPTIRGYSRTANMIWIAVSGLALALIFFHAYIPLLGIKGILLALLWGVSWSSLTGFQMYILKHLDTNTHFPINTTFSLLLTLVVGIFVFGDYLSFWQTMGLVLAVTAILSFVYGNGKLNFSGHVIRISVAAASLSAFGKIIQKIAVSAGSEIHAFQVYAYLFALISALVVHFVTNRGGHKESFSKTALPGSLNGVSIFFGGWSLLIALSRGPFPLITTIHSMYIFMAALLGWMFFKEKIDGRKIFLMVLSIIAVIFMSVG